MTFNQFTKIAIGLSNKNLKPFLLISAFETLINKSLTMLNLTQTAQCLLAKNFISEKTIKDLNNHA